MSKNTTDYDAIVVGAGFSGVRSLWELVQLGLTVKCFDAASDVGGTWYWNRYPGARTDSDAWVYLLNFAREEWGYHERCPSQEEIQRYLSRVVGQYFTLPSSRPVSELRENMSSPANTENRPLRYAQVYRI